MQTTLVAKIGASSRTSASGHCRPVKLGVPKGCSAISRAISSPDCPSMLTKATPSGLAIRPRRICSSLAVQVRHTSLEPCVHMLRYKFSMLRQTCDHGGMISTTRRWSMLAIALTATMCSNVFVNGAAFLIPTLHSRRGLDLAEAGLLSSMPSFGMVITLIAWGYVVDRVGERFVLALGSALTAAAAFGAAAVNSI